MIKPVSTDEGMLAQAFAFVETGRPVFPVAGVRLVGDNWLCTCGVVTCDRPGKHPMTQGGHLDATTDLLVVARWFATDVYNLALPTGNGLVVIDIDTKSGGLQTLDEWQSWTDGGELPNTLKVRTGSGGLHLFYVVPPELRIKSRNGVLPGVDVKGDGGYVVAAGARHACGEQYRWVDPKVAVAAAPEALLNWLLTARGGAYGAGGHREVVGYSFVQAERDGCPAGARDEFFNDLAFRLRKAGLSQAEGLEKVREHWLRCEQPPGDEFAWTTAAAKVARVWATVTPDEVPSWRPGSGGGGGGDGDVTVPGEDPEHPTDLGNAQRLVRLVGGRLRHCAAEGVWYVWDGNSMRVDDTNRALDLTRLVIRDIRGEAERADADQAPRWIQWARQSEATAKRRAMLDAASGEQRLSVRMDDLDADPWSLVVKNGTLDLQTGQLRGSKASDLNTLCCAVAWNENARCEAWLRHVEFLTQGDAALAAYLRRVAGYTLTGLISEQKFFFFEGPGANGKNVFIEPLVAVLGTYAMTGTSALLTGGDEQHATILADLRGRRMVFVDETRQGRPLNAERVKSLTGTGRIRARKMRRDSVEFENRSKLWLAGNNHPTIRDSSDGIWRRMQRIMCSGTLGADKQVPGYAGLLVRDEGPGILRWAVEGLADWRAMGGLGPPAGVEAAVREYRDEEDVVGTYLLDRCEVTKERDDFVVLAELYVDYMIWCGVAGVAKEDRLSRTHFGRALVARKLEAVVRKVGGKAVRGYVGIRLQSETTVT